MHKIFFRKDALNTLIDNKLAQSEFHVNQSRRSSIELRDGLGKKLLEISSTLDENYEERMITHTQRYPNGTKQFKVFVSRQQLC